ncbi:HNH endonuclease [Rhodococcus phage Trina]|uniref:HNH endonuclease n=1 Tax=Rhodococcus phage Trina TaxID=2027905 RepID=A0A2D0ZN10_9CAUD|nr:HNH endonuclease [Rhodococcus phage Trina]ASZ74931.1 HNH endonuclease [Rhodococcus phage Trina]
MIVEEQKLRQAQIVELLIKRDGDFCQFYDCPGDRYKFTDDNFRTIDHVLPRSKGGTDTMDNYVLMHFKCNNKKSDRLYLEDGTLEPLPYREPKNKVVKRAPMSCCNEGRNLSRDEICETCGMLPQPYSFPKWAQRDSKDCDHSMYHCKWCIIGIYERTPVSRNLFGLN